MSKMKAGKEVDTLVAEKLMGWHSAHNEAYPLQWTTPTGLVTWEHTSYGAFKPSSDIATAWELLEKMRLKYGHVVVAWHPFDAIPDGEGGDYAVYSHWSCYIEEVGEATADTAPLAICLAALKSVENFEGKG